MCGISALVAAGVPVDSAKIVAMTRVVRHRGPDGEGYAVFAGPALQPHPFGGTDTPSDCFARSHPFLPAGAQPASPVNARVALGHRRLAIVDLSPNGHQPMADAQRDLWIVYNGEVYNHIELRHELEQRGHLFRSHSDTEVMIAAYREWGLACLDRFNGMFAFVLLDRERGKVFAARDRFGVKPLYYWRTPDGSLAFASEIKQFTALDGWRPRVNGPRARDFLLWGAFDHTEETLFEGVRQLRGGEALEVELEGGTSSVRRWYDLRPVVFAGGRSEAVDRFRELLTDSVRLRLRADVPVGSCLSGGLDSSTIVSLANLLLQDGVSPVQQRTFTAVSDSPRYDERGYAHDVVAATGVVSGTVEPTPEGLFRELETIAWHQDEPFGSTSIYAQWEVFRLAKESSVRVMLDGQGADELLAGYPVFLGSRLAGMLTAGRVAAFFGELRAMQRLLGLAAPALLRQVAASLAPAWAVRWARPDAPPGWLNDRALGLRTSHPSEANPGARRSIRELSAAQLLTTNLPALLHWEDRDSMAHSIEARVPFLDYRLVEFSLGLDDELKIQRGLTKVVLREAMRGVIPERVRARTDKLAFQTAEDEWIRSCPSAFRNALQQSIESSDGIIRPSANEVFSDMTSGRLPHSFLLWRLIAFGVWMRQFSVRTG